MKRNATIALAITFGLLFIGAISLELDLPAKVIMLPGVLAEFELAPIVSPTTIGIGGSFGLTIVLAVSSVAWFFVTFASVAIARGLFCHAHESGNPKNA